MWWCSLGGPICLPVEESDLFVWLAIRTDSTDFAFKARLVYSDPSFFLLALAGFQAANQSPATSLVELVNWWTAVPLKTIVQSPVNKGTGKLAADIHRRRTKWRKLLANSGTAKRIHRQLRKFLKNHASGPDSIRPRKLLSQILSQELLREILANAKTANALPGIHLRLVPNASNKTPCSNSTTLPIDAGLVVDSPPDSDFQRRLLTEKLASLKELAYGASHEINNPLANISMRAEMLMRGEQDPERKRKLTVIRQQAMRAHEMISDLMLFANPPKPQFERCRLDKILHQVVDELRGSIVTGQSRIEVNVMSPLETVVDATQMAESLKAMILNSIQSQLNGGVIRVQAEIDAAGETVVWISDQGQGITDAIARHMFDPFFSGREAGRGLGFGLSKAWRVAELHGGHLICQSRQPGNTVFEIRWPRLPAESNCKEAA